MLVQVDLFLDNVHRVASDVQLDSQQYAKYEFKCGSDGILYLAFQFRQRSRAGDLPAIAKETVLALLWLYVFMLFGSRCQTMLGLTY